jgi:hypothetical protein
MAYLISYAVAGTFIAVLFELRHSAVTWQRLVRPLFVAAFWPVMLVVDRDFLSGDRDDSEPEVSDTGNQETPYLQGVSRKSLTRCLAMKRHASRRL